MTPAYRQFLFANLRKSVIVLAVVVVGLFIYSRANNEALQWEIVIIVAIAMTISSVANAMFDEKKMKKGKG